MPKHYNSNPKLNATHFGRYVYYNIIPKRASKWVIVMCFHPIIKSVKAIHNDHDRFVDAKSRDSCF
jgi:hypothetical protein